MKAKGLQAVESKQMVDEIITMGPAHPYAGGASGGGGHGHGGYQRQNMGGQQYQGGFGGSYAGNIQPDCGCLRMRSKVTANTPP
mgnify:CR=1 FL=1